MAAVDDMYEYGSYLADLLTDQGVACIVPVRPDALYAVGRWLGEDGMAGQSDEELAVQACVLAHGDIDRFKDHGN